MKIENIKPKTQNLDTMKDKTNHKSLASNVQEVEGITRKEAIKRMGKYAAVTAIGSYIILNPMKAQAQSSAVGDSTPANPNTTGQSLFDD